MEELFLRYVFQDGIDLDEAYQVERSLPSDKARPFTIISRQVSQKEKQIAWLSTSKAACPRICVRNVPVGKGSMLGIVGVVKIRIIMDNAVRKFTLQLI